MVKKKTKENEVKEVESPLLRRVFLKYGNKRKDEK